MRWRYRHPVSSPTSSSSLDNDSPIMSRTCRGSIDSSSPATSRSSVSVIMVDPVARFRRGLKPNQDEWYIPYKSPTTNHPPSSYPGIGHSPSPVKQTTNNIRSYFPMPGTSELNKTLRFPRSHLSPSPQPPAHLSQPVPSSASSSAGIPISPISARISTNGSVPSGLTAPRLLFSPLSRQVRGSTYTPPVHAFSPRLRVLSAPVHGQRRPHIVNPYEDKYEAKRWAAPTVCDMFVLPHPAITPHFITPPSSPDEKPRERISEVESKVLEEYIARLRERDEWADYVRQKGRTHTFATLGPIIGNARAREKERERRSSESRRRSNSMSSPWSRHNPGESATSGEPQLGRPSFMHLDAGRSIGVSKSFGFLRRRGSLPKFSTVNPYGEASPTYGDFGPAPLAKPPGAAGRRNRSSYRQGHAFARSSPELASSSKRRPAPGPPRKTLRIQQPPRPRDRDSGVVVINSASSRFLAPPGMTLRRRIPAPLDLGKPLPKLPPEASSSPTLDLESFDSFTTEFNQVISPPRAQNRDAASPPSVAVVRSMPASTESNSPANARAYLAKQHLREKAKRAFQPAAGPSTYRGSRTSDSSTQLDGLKSTMQSTSSTALLPPPRGTTALEEAIGRSRAASTSSPDVQDQPLKTGLHTRPRATGSEMSSPLIPVIPPSPITPLEASTPKLEKPTTTERNPQVNLLTLPVPPISRTETSVSKASKTTDASEGWSRDGDTRTSTPAHEMSTSGHDMSTEISSRENTMDDRDFAVSGEALAARRVTDGAFRVYSSVHLKKEDRSLHRQLLDDIQGQCTAEVMTPSPVLGLLLTLRVWYPSRLDRCPMIVVEQRVRVAVRQRGQVTGRKRWKLRLQSSSRTVQAGLCLISDMSTREKCRVHDLMDHREVL